jgi:O-antigen/teichoic acid export membrane protein
LPAQGSLIARSSIARTAYLFASILVAFYMMPFIIGAIGQRFYGMWTLVATIIGYYGYLDFGLSKAAQQFMAKAIGRQDDDEVNRIITTAIAVFGTIGIVAFVVSLVIAAFAGSFLTDPVELRQFRWVLAVLGLNVMLSFPMMAFNGLFSANFRYDVITGIDLGKLLARSGLIIVFLSAGYSIVSMAVITTAVDFGSNLVKYVTMRRMFRGVALGRNRLTPSLIRPLYGYGGKAFVHSVADILRFQVDAVVVTAFLNLSAVAVYNVGGQLVTYFRQLMGAVVGVIVPLYARYAATDDREKMGETFAFSTKIAASLSVMLGGSALVFGKSFIRVWLGPDFDGSYPVLVILMLGAMVHVAQEPALALVYGTARHGGYARVALIEGVVNALLSVVLVRHLGLRGVAMGTTIPMLLSALYIAHYVARYVRLSFAVHLARMGKIFLLGGVLHAGGWYVLSRFPVDGYLDIFLVFGLVFPVQCILLFLLVFDGPERKTIFSTMRGVLSANR